MDTVGDRPLVHCGEVVPILEGTECMLQSVGGKQFVHSKEVVGFSECQLSEVPLHISLYTLLSPVRVVKPNLLNDEEAQEMNY